MINQDSEAPGFSRACVSFVFSREEKKKHNFDISFFVCVILIFHLKRPSFYPPRRLK